MSPRAKRPGLGADRRLLVADDQVDPQDSRRADDIDERVNRQIDIALSRRLQRATNGRFTFDGNTVVRTGGS